MTTLDNARNATQATANAIEALGADLTGVQAMAQQMSADYQALQADFKASQDHVASLQSQLDAAQATIATLQTQIAAANTVTAKVTVGTLANAGISAAIDAAQPGQTVKVPAGSYLFDTSLPAKLKTGVNIDLTGVVLQVKASALSRSYVLLGNGVTDITITKGEIQGDRLSHDYSGATSEEWNHGVGLTNVKRVNVVGLKVSKMPGDGLSISGSAILLDSVVSIQNRRQGCSIAGGASSGIKIRNCDFSDTGAFNGQAGTAPMAGLDIEPDTGNVDDVEITNTRLTGNDSAGLLLWTRSNTPAMLSVTNVRVTDCDLSGNPNGVNAKSTSGKPMDLTLSQCRLGPNTGSNIRVDANATVNVEGCTFTAVKDRVDFTLTGMDSRTANDIRVLTGGKANVGTNSYK